MKRIFNFLCLVLSLTTASAQYYGGIGDGSVMLPCIRAMLNDQVFYCTGGNDDGFALAGSGTVTLNDQELYCSGGTDDGFSLLGSGMVTLNDQTLYCNGGTNDGTGFGNIAGYFFSPVYYFSGGISDGFSSLFSGQAQIGDHSVYSSGGGGDGFNELAYAGAIYYPVSCRGGSADGFSFLASAFTYIGPAFHCYGGEDDGGSGLALPATYFGRGIWLGAASSAWTVPANWSFGYVPDLSVNVLIPPGKPHYPLILQGNLSVNSTSGDSFCKSLMLQQGATLTNSSGLFIDGEVSIYGHYQADDPNNRLVVINPGGNLHLFSPGVMNIGGGE